MKFHRFSGHKDIPSSKRTPLLFALLDFPNKEPTIGYIRDSATLRANPGYEDTTTCAT
jgi:hypothetical protein